MYIIIQMYFIYLFRYVTGTLPNEPRSMADMRKDEQKWVKRRESLTDAHGDIDLQSDYIAGGSV
jgi:hypothetical protein